MLLPSIPQAWFTLWGSEAVGVVCPINDLLGTEHIAELVRASEANILVTLGPQPSWTSGRMRRSCPRSAPRCGTCLRWARRKARWTSMPR